MPRTEPMTATELSDFLSAVLRGIHAPVTAWNLDWMRTWAASEGTLADNNPLASERPAPGHDSEFNADGVRNYDTAETGIAATVETMLLGYYAPIVASLRAQRFTNRKAILKAYQTWAGVSAPQQYHVASLIADGWQPSGARTRQAEVVTSAPSPRAVVNAHAAKAVPATVAAVPVAALFTAAMAFDWTTLGTDFANHHYAAAIGMTLASPLALTAWRALRSWLSRHQ